MDDKVRIRSSQTLSGSLHGKHICSCSAPFKKRMRRAVQHLQTQLGAAALGRRDKEILHLTRRGLANEGSVMPQGLWSDDAVDVKDFRYIGRYVDDEFTITCTSYPRQ